MTQDMKTDLSGRIGKIRAFAFDIDGVLTNGGIFADLDGELYRTFDAKDAFGIRMAAMHGFGTCVITGGRSESIRKRMVTCGVEMSDIYLGSRRKIDDFNDYCSRHGLSPEEVMYFGDDLPDIPVIRACGIGVCPSDAVEEAKQAADYVSPYPGGRLCVRDTIEMVMRARGEWFLDVDLYHNRF